MEAETQGDPTVVAMGVAEEATTAPGDINNFMFWLQFLAAEARR